MARKSVESNVRIFERELYSILREGYLLRICPLNDRDGVELFLLNKMDVFRAERIANVIEKKYGLSAIYFHRTNSIKVYYGVAH